MSAERSAADVRTARQLRLDEEGRGHATQSIGRNVVDASHAHETSAPCTSCGRPIGELRQAYGKPTCAPCASLEVAR